MIRVMIADDHKLFAEGLSRALDSLPDARVVGVVASGPELDTALAGQPAEVSIVDIEMPGGDGFLRFGAVRATHVGADFIIFDWSYQFDPGNPELHRHGGQETYDGGSLVVVGAR